MRRLMPFSCPHHKYEATARSSLAFLSLDCSSGETWLFTEVTKYAHQHLRSSLIKALYTYVTTCGRTVCCILDRNQNNNRLAKIRVEKKYYR